MMASSQVEFATSSPFGRDSCFRNNLKNLVSSCISNDNIDLTDLWVHHPQWQTTTTTSSTTTTTTGAATNTNRDYDHSSDYSREKDKWARAREAVFPSSSSSSSSSSPANPSGGSNSAKQSVVEVSNLGGVSSLVRKWRGFEAEAKCCSSAGCKSNSGATMHHDNAGHEHHDDDSLGDWESDRTTFSGRSARCSDATESERLRVADIIRKLTEDRGSEVGSDSPPRVRTSWDHSEQRCHSPAVASPRIRGRQAYMDLIMQMERDRRKELEGLVGQKAVTKFSHRGRIQALLRVRFLRRGMETKEGRHSNSASSESHKAVQSAVTHFRERANPTAQNGSMHSGSCCKELTDNNAAAPNAYAPNHIGKDDKCQEVTNTKSCLRAREDRIQDSVTSKENDIHHSSLEANKDIQENAAIVLHGYENLQQEAGPFSAFIRQETNWESSNHSLAKSAETARHFQNTENSPAGTANSLHTNEINECSKEDEAASHEVTETDYDLTGDHANPQSYHQGEPSSAHHIVETDTYWVSDVSNPEVGWEELHSEYQKNEISSSDWMNEVSRPRSIWEDLRQARYQEMLDPFLANEEIRVLLGRKSVSNFLSSGMREKIDQVMICRSQGQLTTGNNQAQEEKHQQLPEQGQAVVSEEGEGEGEGEDGEDEHDEEYGDYFDEFEEAESSLGQQYNESDEYMDQMTASPAASWPQNRGHGSSDYSYQVATPSIQQSPSNYYSQDNGPNSSYRAHPAIEMELIYDLRRHMEQLHQEMSELRKSIKCCTDMQIKLQRSIKKEVATALTHPDLKNGRRDPVRKATSGGRCGVCNKVKVDCVLYRCGHMCTCFKCAHELQWSSGKCPICRAPIMDVVRTYSNY